MQIHSPDAGSKRRGKLPELILCYADLWIRQPGHDVRHHVVQRVPLLGQLSKEQLGQTWIIIH